MKKIWMLVLVMSIGYLSCLGQKSKKTLHVQRARYVVEMSNDSIARRLSLDKLKHLAEEGNRYAYNALGLIYLKGAKIPRDTLYALDMFQRAAALGLGDAMCNVGKLYREGKGGVQKNLKKTYAYYKMGSETGHHLSIYSLARCYYLGEGVSQDYKEAYRLYKEASEFNIQTALFKIGTLTYKGRGVAQDKEKGLEIIKEVYEQGYVKAEVFFNSNNIPYNKR
ncbi:sel1 repeat family protein [Halosquirtibacter xylanolyticus]|uniref:tetratricopeptide repeat protein n=1 Tax=Halosquirtibacter xylanolyticus TaxID=3374599 RepID=UPI00374948B9|nr:sel1 repeat family protein [Prolixibacteraceae bacterium]